MVHACKAAVERPELVSAEIIDAAQHPEIADAHDVGSVPHTEFNDEYVLRGYVQEEHFCIELMALKPVEDFLRERGLMPEGHDHDHDHDHGQGEDPMADILSAHRKGTEEVDIVIVGAGPAGIAAGIYAERSGLSSVILEKSVIGGQVAVTPTVENYPGFASIPGKQLMDIMSAHAREYTRISEGEGVDEIKVGRNIEVFTNRATYVAKALIIATGASWKRLGVPGEDRYFGFGAHYCASCDGYTYQGKKAAIIGGGNTALTDGLHLKNLGVDITIIHRRDSFRGEKNLSDAVEMQRVPVLWNTEVIEILGDGKRVTGLKLRNNQDGTESTMDAEAVFIAIGSDPNNELAKMLGLALDRNGYIKVDQGMRTSIPRIYAAGDITGGVQQIVTAVSEGTTAALSAFEDTTKPYWSK